MKNIKCKMKLLLAACSLMLLASCGIYSFRDVSIDYTKIKTVKIDIFDNKAPGYKNPQLSALLTDKVQQKITSQTKLSRTNSEEADMIIGGYVSDYSVSTSAITATQAATNRLNVGVHLIVKYKNEPAPKEYDVSRNFDFAATLTLQQAEGQLLDQILKNITDDIFNKLFSNW